LDQQLREWDVTLVEAFGPAIADSTQGADMSQDPTGRAGAVNSGGAIDPASAIALFEKMLLIRRFEEMCIRLFEDGVIDVHLHVYIG
jgi:TPP-dependent pyruvate/acetoin dehydrogenase alpha subunit